MLSKITTRILRSQNISAEGLGRLRRIAEDSSLVKGKMIVIVDTAPIISRVETILNEVDQMPVQVLIEAKFIEVEADVLRDVGFEFGTGAHGAETPGVQMIRRTGKNNLYAGGAQQISGTAKPGNFSSLGGLSGTRPFDSGLSVALQQLTGAQLQMLLHLLEEDGAFNILSSPRILTMNHQEATILVGTKFPIINSQTSSSGSAAPTVSTSLEYYENVGIQLKVVPQICDGKYINLIVHPSVREIVSKESGKIGTGNDTSGSSIALTEYPVLSTREAETQVIVQNGRTIVIGGLLKDKVTKTEFKVPFLGSIPLLGALFRRETISNQKIELLIFLTATIRSPAEQIADENLSTAKPTMREKEMAEARLQLETATGDCGPVEEVPRTTPPAPAPQSGKQTTVTTGVSGTATLPAK